MKQYFLPFILSFIAITISAQDVIYDFDSKIEVKKKEKLVESPYSMFGDNTAVLQTKHEEEKDHKLKISFQMDRNNSGFLELDFTTGIVEILDDEKNVIVHEQLNQDEFARFITIDPLAEKYYSWSPYVYCANNPLRFIDPDGREIWVYYEDDEGIEQKMLYTAGMEYKGNNTFVANSISYLNAIYSNGANNMLDVLISSSNMFNIKNLPATDSEGNIMPEAFQFAESATGGGDLYAAAFGNPLISTYNKVESMAHELFHGLQHEKGQGGASIFNEVEANVYSAKVALNWMSNTGYAGAMGTTGLGNGTTQGTTYQNAFNNLIQSFSESSFVDAVKTFRSGSAKNTSGTYNSYPLRKANQTKSILRQFYP